MSIRRAVLLAALTWTPFALDATASASSSRATLVASDSTSVEIAWPSSVSTVRLALPPGTRAAVQRVAAPGGALSPDVIQASAGRFRRLDVVTLGLDRSRAGAGPWTIDLAFVASSGATLPGAPDADEAREIEMLRALDVVNPAQARGFLHDGLAAPAAGFARAKSLGASRVKLVVERDAPVVVTYEQLQAAGATIAGWRTADLRLTSGGAEIAMDVRDGNGDGLFGSGDSIAFFGRALDDVDVPDYFQHGDFTDRNAYFLDAGSGARARFGAQDATPQPATPLSASFLATAHWERDDVFVANTRTGVVGVDHFVSCPTMDSQALPSRTEDVPLPGLATATSPQAFLRARLLARSDGGAGVDHSSEIRVGGVLVSSRQADGPAIVDHAASLSGVALGNPARVEVRVTGASGQRERADLDWLEIDYPRTFAAASGALDFRVTAPARVVVSGLGAGAEALDVTNPDQPARLTGMIAGAGTLELQVTGAGIRRIVVTDASARAAAAPASIASVADTGLADASNVADLLVIGPGAWVSPPLPGVQRYVDWRASQGVRVKLASVDAACDELNDGLFSPACVGKLVATAVNTWSAPPQWVLLLGDANVDYKNLLGGRVLSPSDCSPQPDSCNHFESAWTQLVPTHVLDVPEDETYLGYIASDSLYALTSAGDWMPDVALGRLPARTGAEIEALLDKVVAYERLADAPPAWASRYLTVADEVIPGQEIIETSQDAAAATVPSCYSREQLYFQRDWNAQDPAGFTAELLDAWGNPARGGAVLSYVGHGNTFAWSGQSLLTNAGPSCRNDVPNVAGSGRPEPIVLNADCVAGGFMHLVQPSLLEELVREADGGAIAAFGPTGVTDLAFASPIVSSFYDAIYGPHGRGGRLGDVLLAVQSPLASAAEAGSPHELETNALLGDPSLQLIIPFGPPARTLRVTASSGAADLSWDAVPGASAYRLYRSENGEAGPWTIAADGVTGLSWHDAGLVNAREYTWALEPLAACLPGRWSDAVTATPCDATQAPQPPASVQILSTDCDGEALLSWTASSTPGVAGYVLVARRTGTTLPPEREQVVTGGTFATFTGLVPFRDYVVTVAAFDACGTRGNESAPVALRIACPAQVDPPSFITDLRVRKQGSGVSLAWSPVTTTSQGAPLTPTGYVVHRATQPDFVAASSIVDRPAATSSTLSGRLGALEFFTVAASSPAGDGPAGHDLPQGVRGLSRASSGSDYVLTWTPVRWDVRGDRTAIARYEVHATPSPITRAQADARTPDAIVTSPTATVPQSLGGNHLVIAVDVHGNRSAW